MAESAHPKYRADVDGLRAIAVLSVVLFHGFPYYFPAGFVGVDIFFVISGFLITGIILENLERQRFSLLDFYVRRIRRIYPALILVLLAVLGFGWFQLFADEYEVIGAHVSGGAGFVANILFWLEAGYFDRVADLKPLLHLWSLGVEEQYYLVWPLLMMVLWKWPRLFPFVIAVLLLASFGLSVYWVEQAPSSAFYLIVSRFWELLLGSLLAYAGMRFGLAQSGQQAASSATTVGRWSVYRRPVLEIAAVVGALLLCLAFVFINRNKAFPGWWALLPCLGTVLLIGAGSQTFVNRLLGFKPLVLVGLISYPLYLWHWPLLSFARILHPAEPSRLTKAILIVASFVFAFLTYKWVETPIRNNPSRRPALALFIACALVGVAGFAVYSNDGIASRTVNRVHGNGPALVAAERERRKLAEATEEWEYCDVEGLDEVARNMCRVYGKADGIPIVIWGDSHTLAWSPLFYQLAQEHPLRVYRFWFGGCPPIVQVRRIDDAARERGRCSSFGTAESVLQALHALQPRHIFVIGHWGLYTDSASLEIEGEPAGATRQQLNTALRSHLIATLAEAKEVAPVTVFRSMPQLLNSASRALGRGFPLEPTLKAHRAFEAEMDAAIDQAASLPGDITVFDPALETCDQVTCKAVINNTLLYRDTNHPSMGGVLLFKDRVLHDYLGFLDNTVPNSGLAALSRHK